MFHLNQVWNMIDGGDDDGRLSLIEDEFRCVFAKSIVQGNDGERIRVCGKIRNNPFRTIL